MMEHYPGLRYSRDLVLHDELKDSKWRYALLQLELFYLKSF
jgi:hypothetical protein